jgi:hypothetical protein
MQPELEEISRKLNDEATQWQQVPTPIGRVHWFERLRVRIRSPFAASRADGYASDAGAAYLRRAAWRSIATQGLRGGLGRRGPARAWMSSRALVMAAGHVRSHTSCNKPRLNGALDLDGRSGWVRGRRSSTSCRFSKVRGYRVGERNATWSHERRAGRPLQRLNVEAWGSVGEVSGAKQVGFAMVGPGHDEGNARSVNPANDPANPFFGALTVDPSGQNLPGSRMPLWRCMRAGFAVIVTTCGNQLGVVAPRSGALLVEHAELPTSGPGHASSGSAGGVWVALRAQLTAACISPCFSTGTATAFDGAGTSVPSAGAARLGPSRSQRPWGSAAAAMPARGPLALPVGGWRPGRRGLFNYRRSLRLAPSESGSGLPAWNFN